MGIKLPRKNSRQWKTIIKLINNLEDWVEDVGFGHAELTDDVSRLRQKGWIIIDRLNADMFSRAYKLDEVFWDNIKDTLEKFW